LNLAVQVLEQVACDVCGTANASPVFRRPDTMQVVECEHCGLMYLSPRPETSTIESWYDRGYFSGGATTTSRGYTDYLAEDKLDDLVMAARQKLSLVSRHFNFQNANLLEVGCATGETCWAALQAGARVVGCDLSDDVVQIARERYPDVEFRMAPAAPLPFPDQSFDAVVAFELIEHLSSPSVFIREVHRVLRPGGVLALTTPNTNFGKRVGWNQWTGFSTSFEHLYFFSSASLERALSRNGMSVVEVYSHGDGRISKSRSAGLKTILRRLRLFRLAKVLYRAAVGPGMESWSHSDILHTLMMVCRKQ